MAYYDEKYPDSTFYSSSHAPYDISRYETGCGLRKRRPPSSDHYYRKANDYSCCDNRRLEANMCRNCDCSLRYQPRCSCECPYMPSLYHKLMLAPYTKYSSKNEKKAPFKNKQTQTEAEQRPVSNIVINQRPTQYLAPQVQYQQPTPVTYKIQSQTFQQPQPQIQVQTVAPQPIHVQPMHISQPMHVSQPIHVAQPMPQNIVYQMIPNLVQNPQVLQKSRSNISFQVIPINTQQQIKPVVVPSSQLQPMVLQPANQNIVRKVDEKAKIRPSLVLKPTSSEVFTPSPPQSHNDDDQSLSIKVTNEHKNSSIVLKKPQKEPVQMMPPTFPFNMTASNTASFGNFMQANAMKTSQNQVSFSTQQKSQQVSYSTSQSQSKQIYSKTMEMESKQATMENNMLQNSTVKPSSRRMLASSAHIQEKFDYNQEEN